MRATTGAATKDAYVCVFARSTDELAVVKDNAAIIAF